MTKLHVLLVEDNRDTAQSTAALLRRWGHNVRVALDGPTALREADEDEPDVVLLDIGLPGMDGYKVARRLRETLHAKGTLFIVISGYGAEKEVLRSKDEGIDLHFVKPADPAELREELERFARARQGNGPGVAELRGEIVENAPWRPTEW